MRWFLLSDTQGIPQKRVIGKAPSSVADAGALHTANPITRLFVPHIEEQTDLLKQKRDSLPMLVQSKGDRTDHDE